MNVFVGNLKQELRILALTSGNLLVVLASPCLLPFSGAIRYGRRKTALHVWTHIRASKRINIRLSVLETWRFCYMLPMESYLSVACCLWCHAYCFVQAV